MKRHSSSDTSWQSVGKWYNQAVGADGHYYHQHLILPNVIKLLDFPKDKSTSLLDLACGQGIMSRVIPKNVSYTGLDASKELIQAAKNYQSPGSCEFIQADVTKPFPIKKIFNYATLILALQNIEFPELLFKHVHTHLEQNAPFILVLNHPYFRIPRQSSWKVDQEQKIQYRRIDKYMSSMTIPIQAHPGKGKASAQTVSFHHPFSLYSLWLKNAGFTIDLVDEWCSNKVSEGGAAKMENRSRQEFPLFMVIVARKK